MLGGDIRTPKVIELLEKALEDKELGVHLHGDEAMCFGGAFIGSNSTTSFKVASVMLTQNPDFELRMIIEPMDPADALSEADQRAEGAEDEDIIKYTQDLRLFNSSDYYGKSKGLTMSYDKNMRLKFYKAPIGSEAATSELELLDTFELNDLKSQYEAEVKWLETQAEKAKKKEAKKKGNSTDNSTDAGNATDAADAKEETVDTDGAAAKTEKPKLKLSVLLSRSGYVQIKSATVGSMHVTANPVSKASQLSKEAIQAAKKRLKWYGKRDDDKIKTDSARNDFESMIYKMREWPRDDDNAAYVEESNREERLTQLTELEDWLYEDGASANFSVYEGKHKELQ